jgi:hypothetical protein
VKSREQGCQDLEPPVSVHGSQKYSFRPLQKSMHRDLVFF